MLLSSPNLGKEELEEWQPVEELEERQPVEKLEERPAEEELDERPAEERGLKCHGHRLHNNTVDWLCVLAV